MRYPGMIVAVVVLAVLGLTAFIMASPLGQQFVGMYGNGGSQFAGIPTGQSGYSGFGMPW